MEEVINGKNPEPKKGKIKITPIIINFILLSLFIFSFLAVIFYPSKKGDKICMKEEKITILYIYPPVNEISGDGVQLNISELLLVEDLTNKSNCGFLIGNNSMKVGDTLTIKIPENVELFNAKYEK